MFLKDKVEGSFEINEKKVESPNLARTEKLEGQKRLRAAQPDCRLHGMVLKGADLRAACDYGKLMLKKCYLASSATLSLCMCK